MKRFSGIIILLAFLLCFALRVNAQSTTNQGTEFWTAWMMHSNGASGTGSSSMNLYITGDAATTGTVSLADGSFSANFTVTPNTITTIPISSSAYLDGQAQFNKGIHITAAKPIVVYAHIFAANRSGATLVLPVASLTNDYYALSYRQKAQSTGVNGPGNTVIQVPVYSTVCVIAAEDATTVEITPSATLADGTAKGQVKTITLKKGELYQALSLTDLTGTRVRSVSTTTGTCQRIAVYSGSSFMTLGDAGSSGDNFFQQNYPTAVWGKNFITAPLSSRAYDYIRIATSDPAATVTVNGKALDKTLLSSGFYYDLAYISTPQVISSDRPIQVAQYAVTQGNGNSALGDPEMIYLSPIEQGLDHVTLYSPKVYNISQSYVNVILASTAVSSFTVDGVAYTAFTPIAGSSYSYAQVPVTSNATHLLRASTTFNAIAYGFGSLESYGYAAGTNLSNLTEFITLSGTGTGPTQLSGCTGVPYFLELTVPYQPTKIVWDPADGSGTVTQNNPSFAGTTTKDDGTVLYTYRFERKVTYRAGSYTATATVTVPVITSSACGAEKPITFDFNIADYPVANFTPSVNNCAGNTISFTDASDAAGSTITKYSWEFDDPYSTTANPNTSSAKDPQHTFTVGGRDYNVKLTVVNQNGCESATLNKVVHINANPTANFKYVAPTCAGQEVTFNDLSAANEGVISQWIWDFGDGTAEQTMITGDAFTHVFPDLKTYHVTLKVVTDKGCTSTVVAKDIVIHPVPTVDFLLPEACLVDIARFTNISTISDGSEGQFTYEWDYGDGSAKTAAANGAHQYTTAGTFTVKLKVTSKDGCSFETSKQFELNGAFPKPEFDIPDQICSSDDLIIVDKSTVTPGKIVRYDVYYDYDRHPTEFIQYDKDHTVIPADKRFLHNYGYSNSPAYTDYHIKIVVYSGNSASCQAVYDKPAMRVYSNPEVTFDPPTVVCQSDPAFTITPVTTFAGTGLFVGGGITSGGTFDPKRSGPGDHTITYTFTADAGGCIYTRVFKIKVLPTPVVTGYRDITILAGSQVTLEPVVVSVNSTPLTYSWSPRTGLSNPSSANPVASPSADIQYTLTVQSTDNCPATAIFNIKVLQQPVVYNTFTPNNDGRNDTWVIQHLERYPKATVEVFDRGGERVYYSIGYPNAWDGRYKGKDLPVGAYYYIIDPKNGKPAITGSVTIVR